MGSCAKNYKNPPSSLFLGINGLICILSRNCVRDAVLHGCASTGRAPQQLSEWPFKYLKVVLYLDLVTLHGNVSINVTESDHLIDNCIHKCQIRLLSQNYTIISILGGTNDNLQTVPITLSIRPHTLIWRPPQIDCL